MIPGSARWPAGDAIRLAREVADILDERVDGAVPSWCERRGWTSFLLGLSDDELRLCEAEGLARLAGLPASLANLARAAGAATELPRLPGSGARPWPREALRAVRARKVLELEGLLGAVERLAGHARRVVDVGSGSGHLTRLAAELFELEAVGLERDAGRVAAAEARAALSRERSGAARGEVRFRKLDAGREPLVLEARRSGAGVARVRRPRRSARGSSGRRRRRRGARVVLSSEDRRRRAGSAVARGRGAPGAA